MTTISLLLAAAILAQPLLLVALFIRITFRGMRLG
jgi:hypothetical protein